MTVSALRAKSLIGRGYDRFLTGIGYLVAASICAMAVLITIDVGLRAFRIGNLPWLNEVAEYALYAGTFLAAPWALRLGAHVRIDIVVDSLPDRASRSLEQFVDLLGGGVCAVLLYFGCVGTLEAYEFGHMQFKTITIPNWPLLSVFAFSMLLLTIEFAFRFARASRTGAARDEDRDLTSGM